MEIMSVVLMGLGCLFFGICIGIILCEPLVIQNKNQKKKQLDELYDMGAKHCAEMVTKLMQNGCAEFILSFCDDVDRMGYIKCMEMLKDFYESKIKEHGNGKSCNKV